MRSFLATVLDQDPLQNLDVFHSASDKWMHESVHDFPTVRHSPGSVVAPTALGPAGGEGTYINHEQPAHLVAGRYSS